MFKKITAPAGFAIAAGFCALTFWVTTVEAVTGPNPLTTKKDPSAMAYYDTTFATSAASDEYITWGFPASKVTINLITASQQVQCQILGRQDLLRSSGGGSAVNPRTGLTAVNAEVLTLPALSTYVYDADNGPLFYGLRVLYTGGACTVIVSAVRGK